MIAFVRAFFISALLAVGTSAPVQAQGAPYDEKLLRLGEVLGSLHYLRNLCGETGDLLRQQMETLIVSENPSPERRARLVASFNRGYGAFANAHTTCTASSMEAIRRYMSEADALSRDIVVRYGG